MAKRFTDTGKWQRSWFRKLNSEQKLMWLYLLDTCDYAGIFVADFNLMSFQIGQPISQSEFEELMKGKVIAFDGDKYFIPSFIRFQYGEILKSSTRVHQKVIHILKKYSLVDHVKITVGGTVKEEEEEEDKDMDMDKEERKEKEEEEKEEAAISIQKFRDIKARLTNAKAMPPKASS